LHADLFTRDGYREAAALALAEDRQHHLGARLAAHALDGLFHRQTLDGGVVDLGDQVAGLQARAEGGRAFDRRDDLHQAVFHADLDAHADEPAARAFAEFLEALLVEVLRVRVEAGHHAADRVGDQLLLVDRLDVIGLHQAEHVGQLLHFLQRQGRRAGRGLQLHRGERAGDGAQGDQACDFEFRAHDDANSNCKKRTDDGAGPVYGGTFCWRQ
jgi:hypothetical protein